MQISRSVLPRGHFLCDRVQEHKSVSAYRLASSLVRERHFQKKTFKLENKSVNREHDKDPDTFFETLYVLIKEGLHFRLSVLGEQFFEVPPVFGEAKEKLIASGQCDIVDWGFVPRSQFVKTLSLADVVVSTATHEFFGVSM